MSSNKNKRRVRKKTFSTPQPMKVSPLVRIQGMDAITTQVFKETPRSYAKSDVERWLWNESTMRVDELLVYAIRLYGYLHGYGGDPAVVNNVSTHVNALRASMHEAIVSRQAVSEVIYKAKKRTRKAERK